MSEASLPSRPPRRREFRYDPSELRGEEVYVDARRHSGLVRWLKIILPVTAVACIAAFFVAIKIVTSDVADLFQLAGVTMDTKSLIMEKPHLSGFKGTEHSYEVTAERAVQDLANPKIVKLETIQAEFGLTAEVKVNLTAAAGVFDGDNEKLELKDGITVSSTNGYAARLDTAHIDFRTKEMTSQGMIEISATEGLVRAHTLKVGEQGKKILFGGGVSVTYMPPDGTLPAAPSEPSDAARAAETAPAIPVIQ
jgi:lipopolysaccharide export system protein LptC